VELKAEQALCGFRSRPTRKGDHQPETAIIEWPVQGEKPGDLPPFGLGRRLAGVSGSYLDVPFAGLGLLLRPIAASLVLTPWRRFVSQDIPLNSVLGSSVRMEYAIVGLGSARRLDQG
jgi:hypothetical protein